MLARGPVHALKTVCYPNGTCKNSIKVVKDRCLLTIRREFGYHFLSIVQEFIKGKTPLLHRFVYIFLCVA